jgi:acetyltransferase-like isoleucine patch superfamily enzyme
MANLYRFLAHSEHPLARAVRGLHSAFKNFSIPAPRFVFKPLLWIVLGIRSAWYFFLRVFVCEPFFKAYCTKYGRGLRTDVYIHWMQGKGDIIVGDDVIVDGKCTFAFASSYSEHPTLLIGDHSGIGHACKFVVGNRITIGRHCRIGQSVWMFDSTGHASDPAKRLSGMPPEPEEVRPIHVGDNVWIGDRVIVFPGVMIGEGSVIAPASVVTSDVPANTIAMGNPARKIAALKPATDNSLAYTS